MTRTNGGVQPERTELAWGRTGLAITVNAVLILRTGLMTHHPWLVALACVLFVAAAVAIVGGMWRANRLRSTAQLAAPPPALMRLTVAAAMLCCAAALASLVVTSD